MQVKHTLEKPDGSLVFEGTLTARELDYVVQVGIEYLMYHGLLPAKESSVNLHNKPFTKQ